MAGQFAIIARFVAKPGCAEALREILLETATIAFAEEPGCRRFEILQGVDVEGNPAPDVLMTNELFDDYDAVVAHRDSWRTPIRVERIRPLVAGPDGVRIEMAIVVGGER